MFMELDKLKKLLGSASPKFLLDHYWEILDLIEWRLLIGSERKFFTISELKEKILEDAQIGKSSPIRYRECIKSLKIADQIVNELEKLGLLLREGNILIKSDVYSDFFRFLKNRIRNSVRKRIAWAIWFLYNTKKDSNVTIDEICLLYTSPSPRDRG